MENGHFGSNENRSLNNQSNNSRGGNNVHIEKFLEGLENLFDVHSPTFYVDIICITIIAVFVIAVCCNWHEISDFIFEHILFPVIDVVFSILSKFLVLGTVILGVGGWIKRRLHF